MNAKEEVKKWKDDFCKAKTDEQKTDHKKRFDAFFDSLSDNDKKEFREAFKQGMKDTEKTIKELVNEVNLKKQLAEVQDIVSFSYIAEHYFGKTRQWLYQKINGNSVNGKPAKFTHEELEKLKYALDDICNKINNTSQSIVFP